eukprot:2410007-Rhodomonas_salina.3
MPRSISCGEKDCALPLLLLHEPTSTTPESERHMWKHVGLNLGEFPIHLPPGPGRLVPCAMCCMIRERGLWSVLLIQRGRDAQRSPKT